MLWAADMRRYAQNCCLIPILHLRSARLVLHRCLCRAARPRRLRAGARIAWAVSRATAGLRGRAFRSVNAALWRRRGRIGTCGRRSASAIATPAVADGRTKVGHRVRGHLDLISERFVALEPGQAVHVAGIVSGRNPKLQSPDAGLARGIPPPDLPLSRRCEPFWSPLHKAKARGAHFSARRSGFPPRAAIVCTLDDRPRPGWPG